MMRNSSSFAKKLRRLFKYGLVMEAIAERMKKIGINIQPYYLIQETLIENWKKEFEDCFKVYDAPILSAQDMLSISQDRGWPSIQTLEKRLEQGMKCFGVKLNGQLVAFTWANLDECNFKGVTFSLKNNEAYLFDAYTFPAFRGKGLAPAIRYQCYQSLYQMGITKYYSVSYYFNTPAIAFKKKLGAKFLKLGIWVQLFNKFDQAYILKNYR